MRALAHKTSRMSIGNVMPFGNKWTLQPKIEWVKEIVEACDKASIPVFLKDNLKPLILQAAYRGEVGDDYVLEGKLRQEMPNA